MYAQLEDKLPILEVAGEGMVSKMGDLTIALELMKPELFTLGQAEYEKLHQTYVKALRLLPAGTVWHMQDLFFKDQVKGMGADGKGSFLQRASDGFFEGRPYLRHSCHLYLTRKPAGRRKVTSGTSGLLRGTLVPEGTLDQGAWQDFEEIALQVGRILSDSGLVKVRRMGTAELASEGKRAGAIERYCFLLDDRDRAVIRDIDLKGDIRVGEHRCLLFTLADAEKLPAQCSPWVAYGPYCSEKTVFPIGYMAGMGLLFPHNHMVNQFIVVQDVQETLKAMEARRRRLQSLAGYSRENAVAQKAAEAFLNEAVSEQRLPVRVHVNLMAWADTEAELREIRNLGSSVMAGMDAVAHVETVGAPQLWYAGIPGNAGDLPDNECFDSFAEQACCFLVMESGARGSDSDFGVRFGDRLTGRPLLVDMDDEPRRKGWTQNGNLFVLSGSGGGKSFWTNHVCRSYYDQGMHLVIVDVGHSYQVLCRLLGGYYFTYDQASPLRFNPFYIGVGEVFDVEKKESLKSLLMALWKRSDETQYRSEYVALSMAIQLYYDGLTLHPDIFPCFDSFYEFLETDYVQALSAQGVKAKEFDVFNFLYVLRPYYRGGEFDFLLNARENLDLLHQRFIVFELDAVKDHPILFPVLTLVIMDVFMEKMRRLRGVRKMIVVEEAWKSIANAGMAENIRYWVKTLRKFMGKLALVSQEVDDMIGSAIIKEAIINNSDCKILLDQSKFANRFDDIQALLGLTDKHKAEILSINKGHEPGSHYKDFWVGLGPDHSRVYRLETSAEEYFVYTSDQGDKVRLEAVVAECGGDWEKAIEWVAARWRTKK